jgi:hypothetical protein
MELVMPATAIREAPTGEKQPAPKGKTKSKAAILAGEFARLVEQVADAEEALKVLTEKRDTKHTELLAETSLKRK